MSAGFSSLKQTLGRFREASKPREPVERCELCGLSLATEHRHLVELASQRLICSCEACGLLFSGQATKYRRVPLRFLLLQDFALSDAQWDSLLIPINMAFFFRSTLENRIVTLYPSPAGAVESLLPLDAWNEIVEENAILAQLRPDIEALLVNRVGHAHELSRAEYYIAPIDECYRLVGLIRANWKGLSGGTEVWEEIGRFFSGLRSRADLVSEEAHA